MLSNQSGVNARSRSISTVSLTQRVVDACQKAVLERLKAPATAVFSPDDEELFAEPGFNAEDGRWMYFGNVDSENGFGALLRSEYACQITDDLADVTITLDE